MKRFFIICSLAILLPVSAGAAEFTASVGSDHVETGKSFVLQLTLSGAKARAHPDTDALKKSFTVVSEEHSANATSSGQSANFSVDWELTLRPKREGQLTIPSIAVETSAGRLQTAAIELHIEKPSPAIPSQFSADGSKISISASASNTTPYRNQPIRYTIKCVVLGGISKVAMEDISIANAIVERQGKPTVYSAVEKGVPVKVVEIHYLITPLQPGRMVVPPAVLKGEMQGPAFAPMVDPFGGRFMLSARAQQAMNFFSIYGGEPFTVASNQTVLEVKPSVGTMDPWLPLRSLKISEDVGASAMVRVGDLVTRKIRLLADGAVGAQLPSLEAQQNREDFGVYADKPATGEDVDEKTGAITGWRNESYSLIPQRSGRQVLPAVKVTWWDVVHKKAATTVLPEKIITVLPSAALKKPSAGGASVVVDHEVVRSLWARILPRDMTGLWYGLIGVLAVALSLFAAVFWRLRVKAIGAPRTKIVRAEKILKDIRTVEELRDFLRDYGRQYLARPANASLEEVFSDLPKSWKPQDLMNVTTVLKSIDAALYAGRAVDMDDLKSRCRRIMAALKRRTGHPKSSEKLPVLNPS